MSLNIQNTLKRPLLHTITTYEKRGIFELILHCSLNYKKQETHSYCQSTEGCCDSDVLSIQPPWRKQSGFGFVVTEKNKKELQKNISIQQF